MLLKYYIFIAIIATILSCSVKPKNDNDSTGGDSDIQIIIASNCSRTTLLAADELKYYLDRITHRETPINFAPSNKFKRTIFVGKSRYTDARDIGGTETLQFGAFKIHTADNWLALIGNDTEFIPTEPYPKSNADIPNAIKKWDQLTSNHWGNPLSSLFRHYCSDLDLWEFDERGSLNAVYAFLRSVGVRWYMPGKIGEVIPTLKEIEFPKTNELHEPEFAIRNFYQYGRQFFMASKEEILWQLRLGLNSGQEILGHGTFGHGLNAVVTRDYNRENHPEFYALSNGARDNKKLHNPKVCLSSKALLDSNVKYIQAVFDLYKEPIVSVMPADGFIKLCECTLCQKKINTSQGEKGKYSDYVWEYVNEIGKQIYKTHPDKKILCFAYSTYLLPPKNIAKFNPNILVGICRNRSEFYNAKEKLFFRELDKEWREISSNKLVNWDYYLHAKENSSQEAIPVVYPHTIYEDLKYLKDKSYGEFIEVFRPIPAKEKEYNDLAVNHLNMYITSQLYWDTNKDVDLLLKDYYQQFYGPAASEMNAFFTYCEQHWPEMTTNENKIQKALDLIERAQKVNASSEYAKRIESISNYIKPLIAIKNSKETEANVHFNARVLSRRNLGYLLDGNLDEPFWKGLHAYPLDALSRSFNPKLESSVKFAWKPEALYLGIVCKEEDISTLRRSSKSKKSDSSINDEIEVAIKTLDKTEYTLKINSSGKIRGIKNVSGKKSDWSSGALAAIDIRENYWSIEIEIPMGINKSKERFNDFSIKGRLPSTTFPWFINVYRKRIRGNKNEHFSLALARNAKQENTFARLLLR